MDRRTPLKRVLVALSIFALSTGVVIATAWCFAVWGTVPLYGVRWIHSPSQLASNHDVATLFSYDSTNEPSGRWTVEEARQLGVTTRIAARESSDGAPLKADSGWTPSQGHFWIRETSVGWPFRCLSWMELPVDWRQSDRRVRIINLKQDIRYGLSVSTYLSASSIVPARALPLAILPIGFSLNLLFTITMLWGGTVSARKFMQQLLGTRRERAGKCRICGYRVAGLPTCPECGYQVHLTA